MDTNCVERAFSVANKTIEKASDNALGYAELQELNSGLADISNLLQRDPLTKDGNRAFDMLLGSIYLALHKMQSAA